VPRALPSPLSIAERGGSANSIGSIPTGADQVHEISKNMKEIEWSGNFWPGWDINRDMKAAELVERTKLAY